MKGAAHVCGMARARGNGSRRTGWGDERVLGWRCGGKGDGPVQAGVNRLQELDRLGGLDV